MRKFAEGTGVPVEKSESEIKKILRDYGASSIGSLWESHRAVLQFEAHGYRVRFQISLPSKHDFRETDSGRKRNVEKNVDKAHDSEVRRLFRCLKLAIQAKLESVESKIESFEDAFLASIVDPNSNETISERFVPALIKAYNGAALPPLLGTGK